MTCGRAIASKPTGGSSPDSDPRWPEHLLTCVNEEVEKLMAQMAQMAYAVQLNGMPQVHARLKELRPRDGAHAHT